MAPENFRNAFLEHLQELTTLLIDEASGERVSWLVEYSSRNGIFYRFDGVSDFGRVVASGQAHATGSETPDRLDAALLPFVMLDFNENAAIRAYCGGQQSPSGILLELVAEANCVPEVVRVVIDRESSSECGRMLKTSTHFAYIGFRHLRDIGESVATLFTASDAPLSPVWFRGRIKVSPLTKDDRDQIQYTLNAR